MQKIAGPRIVCGDTLLNVCRDTLPSSVCRDALLVPAINVIAHKWHIILYICKRSQAQVVCGETHYLMYVETHYLICVETHYLMYVETHYLCLWCLACETSRWLQAPLMCIDTHYMCLHITHYLFIAHYTLFIAHYTLRIAHYTLFIAHYTLFIVHYIL